jgi:UDP-glucose 4-epimerase
MKNNSKTINKSRKKILVCGGSGFLGSHVADMLSDQGYMVIIYDLTSSPFLRKDQKMIVGDILNRNSLEKAVAGCEYVYNFAGIADLDNATTKPMDTIMLNIVANTNLMDAAIKAKAKRFIYASTIYVYSEKGGFYRCSKQAAELYIEEYQRSYGLDFTILRYSTLYGSRANENNSVYRYLKEAVLKGGIHCSGTGEAVRDYVNVRDAARLSVDILDEKYRNQHIIISGNHPIRFKDMVSMIKEILAKNIKINFSGQENSAHYNYTPYSFAPKIGYKLTSNLYLDMGQGLLECLHEIHDQITNPKKTNFLTIQEHYEAESSIHKK